MPYEAAQFALVVLALLAGNLAGQAAARLGDPARKASALAVLFVTDGVLAVCLILAVHSFRDRISVVDALFWVAAYLLGAIGGWRFGRSRMR